MKVKKLLKTLLLSILVCLALFAFTACGSNSDGGEEENSTYTITYNLNGGTANYSELEVEFGQGFKHPTPSRSGYTFDGWFLNGSEYNEGLFTYKNDITVEARWTAIFKFDTSTGEMKGLISTMAENLAVYIPSEIDGATVKTITAESFAGNENIISVSIPASVTTIEDGAFDMCTKISSVAFRGTSSLKTIGDNAFAYCESLKQITFPNSLISIGDSAFYNCSNLTKINFATNGSLQSIGESAFGFCVNLADLTFPTSLKTIGASAFKSCSGLISVNKVDGMSLEKIDNSAFESCAKLEVFYNSTALKTLGASAFSGCSSLVSLVLPKTLENIGNNAFYGCTSISLLSEASGKQNGWSISFNPNGRPVGYNLTELTNADWQKQTVAENRGEEIVLSLKGTPITSKAAVKSAVFNGRAMSSVNFSVAQGNLYVSSKGVKTGDALLTVSFISGGNAYILNSEQNVIDYKIGTKKEFEDFMADVISQPTVGAKVIHAVLTNNIDMEGANISSRQTGDKSTTYSCFSGSLDGQGYSISNFANTRQGLFWHINTATIKNIGFTNVTGAGGESQKALLCWSASNVTLENVYMQGEIDVSNNKHVAGVCYSVSGISFKNFVIDVEFVENKEGAEPVYTINKGVPYTNGTNVYAISSTANGFGANKSNTGHDFGWYKTVEELKSAIKPENLAKFDTNYWDITSGVPVWKNA